MFYRSTNSSLENLWSVQFLFCSRQKFQCQVWKKSVLYIASNHSGAGWRGTQHKQAKEKLVTVQWKMSPSLSSLLAPPPPLSLSLPPLSSCRLVIALPLVVVIFVDVVISVVVVVVFVNFDSADNGLSRMWQGQKIGRGCEDVVERKRGNLRNYGIEGRVVCGPWMRQPVLLSSEQCPTLRAVRTLWVHEIYTEEEQYWW